MNMDIKSMGNDQYLLGTISYTPTSEAFPGQFISQSIREAETV